MSSSRTAASSADTSSSTTIFRVFQVFAGLTLLSVAFQFVTAGRLFPEGPEELHAVGAIVLHVVSGVAVIAAGLQWYRTRTSLTIAVLALVVFVFTFIQAATGGRSSLAVHVPGAFVLTIGATWLAVWAFTRPASA